MAKYYERLTTEAANDVRTFAAIEAITLHDYSSQLFKAIAGAVQVYRDTLAQLEAEAADDTIAQQRDGDRKAAEATIAEAEATRKAAEAEAIKVFKAAEKAAKLVEAEAIAAERTDLSVPKLMSRIAILAAEKAEAIAEAEATRDVTIAEAAEAEAEATKQAEATIAELDKLTTEAEAIAAEAAIEYLQENLQGSGGSGGSGGSDGLTWGKVTAEALWFVGKHRDGKSDLMAGHGYTGYFLFRPSDRAVYFRPSGHAYNGAPLGKYTELSKGEWYHVGYMADCKDTRSLTGIVRWCREFIYLADLDDTIAEHTQRVNDRAIAGNLFKNAGGSVFMTKATEADYTLPAIAEADTDDDGGSDD